MRRILLSLSATLAWPQAAGAQSFDSKDWQVVCDNTRACRAAGYSVQGSDNPVSLLIARASGPGQPVYGELQLGTLDPRAVHPASVALAGAGKAAAVIRIDRSNHAGLAPPALAAVLKTLSAGADVVFTAGKTTWRVSANGALEALQQMDDVQGRAGRTSALVRRGSGSDADVASPMAVPRFEAGNIAGPHQPGDDALVVRVMASVRSDPACPLLDDGAAQAAARLWHLDANRLLVSQACRTAAEGGGLGYWLANQRPPYDAQPMTYAGTEFDAAMSSVHATAATAPDCASKQSWTWNGYRFEQTYAASSGLCRGVKAGGAWELPTLVSDVVPGR